MGDFCTMLIGSLVDLFNTDECSDRFVRLDARLVPSYFAEVQNAAIINKKCQSTISIVVSEICQQLRISMKNTLADFVYHLFLFVAIVFSIWFHTGMCL